MRQVTITSQNQNLELQLDALEKAGSEKIFRDIVSGARTERKGLDNLLEYIREGDVLVVWKMDRVGRSLKHLIELMESLEKRGIEFISLTESIDTSTPMGRMTFHIFAAIAQFERDLIRERTQAGLTAAKARGRKGGRPPALDDKRVYSLAKVIASDPDRPMEVRPANEVLCTTTLIT